MKHCGAGLAGLFFIILTLVPGAFPRSGTVAAAPPDERPRMVFSSFPSDGMSELFRRVLTEAYAELGYMVAIWKLPAERALILANDGMVDGEAARVPVIEKDCPNLVRVPTPIYINRIAVLTKRTDYDPSMGFEGLAGYRLSVRNGYKFLEKATMGMDRHTVSSYEKLLALLESDRVDFGLAEYFDILPTLAEVPLEGVKVLDKPLAINPMYHYLHRKHEKLVPKINAVLRRMDAQGRMEAIAHEMLHELLGDSLTPCPMLRLHN